MRSPLPWGPSLVGHLLFIGLFFFTGFFEKPPAPPKKSIARIKVVEKEKPIVAKKIQKQQPVVIKKQKVKKKPKKKRKKKKPVKAKAKKKRRVFGISKKSRTSRKKSRKRGPRVKVGNTVATKPQGRRLKKGEEELPEPTEEYLVSEMPELISEILIKYPKEAREKQIEGVVIMRLLIDAKGTVRKAELLEGPGFGLNAAALKAIKRFRFKPAKIGDKSVPVQIRYGYRFVLEK